MLIICCLSKTIKILQLEQVLFMLDMNYHILCVLARLKEFAKRRPAYFSYFLLLVKNQRSFFWAFFFFLFQLSFTIKIAKILPCRISVTYYLVIISLFFCMLEFWPISVYSGILYPFKGLRNSYYWGSHQNELFNRILIWLLLYTKTHHDTCINHHNIFFDQWKAAVIVLNGFTVHLIVLKTSVSIRC